MRSHHHLNPGLGALCVLAVAALLLSACGGGGAARKQGPPGSRSNPLIGDTSAEEKAKGPANEAAAAQAPGYQRLLEKQTKRPRSGFTPCNLVSPAQASAILGEAVRAPLEAPQGPTCIYRTRKGQGLVTVAVQSLDLPQIKRQLRDRRRIAVSGRTAYCGNYGQPMLYAGLPGGRVLTIGARCGVAQRFASLAVRRLS
jgi:Protein of unknown function (DUF3558)